MDGKIAGRSGERDLPAAPQPGSVSGGLSGCGSGQTHDRMGVWDV